MPAKRWQYEAAVIIECDRCYARYKYDEARFEGRASKMVRCTRCLAVFEIFNTRAYEASSQLPGWAPEETIFRLPTDEGRRDPEPTPKKSVSAARRPGATELKMPAASKLSLAVIAGPESGKIYPIEKPRVVIG